MGGQHVVNKCNLSVQNLPRPFQNGLWFRKVALQSPTRGVERICIELCNQYLFIGSCQELPPPEKHVNCTVPNCGPVEDYTKGCIDDVLDDVPR